jgi:hypothetical protein
MRARSENSELAGGRIRLADVERPKHILFNWTVAKDWQQWHGITTAAILAAPASQAVQRDLRRAPKRSATRTSYARRPCAAATDATCPVLAQLDGHRPVGDLVELDPVLAERATRAAELGLSGSVCTAAPCLTPTATCHLRTC